MTLGGRSAAVLSVAVDTGCFIRVCFKKKLLLLFESTKVRRYIPGTNIILSRRGTTCLGFFRQEVVH